MLAHAPFGVATLAGAFHCAQMKLTNATMKTVDAITEISRRDRNINLQIIPSSPELKPECWLYSTLRLHTMRFHRKQQARAIRETRTSRLSPWSRVPTSVIRDAQNYPRDSSIHRISSQW